jgi:molybdate transport system substrate-binding protein
MRQPDGMLRSQSRAVHAWLIAIIAFATWGCGDSGRNPPAAPLTTQAHGESTPGTPLRIAAASDLQAALPEVANRFRAMTGIESSLTFGPSGQLAEQIKPGAPFDVLLSANESFVRDLAAAGLVKPDSVRPYARGSLVLAVYHTFGEQVRSLNDLTIPEVKKIALANPATAPYGKAGKQALERAGLWEKVQPKIVFAESVRQALLYAQRGDAEAAIVGKAIANVPEIRVVKIDASLHDPIIQALGVVSASTRVADAEQFARFVLDQEGPSILKEFGFASPGDDREAASREQTRPAAKSISP